MWDLLVKIFQESVDAGWGWRDEEMENRKKKQCSGTQRPGEMKEEREGELQLLSGEDSSPLPAPLCESQSSGFMGRC